MGIKIMHLIGSMDLGGAEKLTRLIVEGLPTDEFEASVCCIKSGGVYADQLRARGFCVVELLGVHKHTSVSLFLLLRAAWHLFRLLRRERPTVLHTHLFAANCLGRVVAKLAGVKHVIVTIHRVEYPRLQRWIEGLLALWTGLYVTDSRAASAVLSSDLKIPQTRIAVIYNGIECSEFAFPPTREVARVSLNLEDQERVIGVIAHLYKEKGHAFLLESLAQVQDKIPGFKLLIVGDGYLREELEQLAGELFPDGSVLFLGQRGDLARLLAAMDVFVLPSSWEGFGIILAEAMYMRIPVVTTRDSGGCAEVVDDCGLLVPYGDTLALSHAISRLLTDDSYRCELGNLGRARVESLFTSERMCAEYATVYRGILHAG